MCKVNLSGLFNFTPTGSDGHWSEEIEEEEEKIKLRMEQHTKLFAVAYFSCKIIINPPKLWTDSR